MQNSMKRRWKLAISHEFKQKFEKSLTNFCWNFEIWAVQKSANPVDLEKPAKTLQNEYLVAIVAVHTAENEPLKVWVWFHSFFIRLLTAQLRVRVLRRFKVLDCSAGVMNETWRHSAAESWKLEAYWG